MIIELDDNEMCLVINAVYVYKHNTYYKMLEIKMKSLKKIEEIIVELKKEAKIILEKTISDKNFPIYEICKELKNSSINFKLYLNPSLDLHNLSKLICNLFESSDSVKIWQDDMSNFSIDQLKFKATEEFKNKYLENIRNDKNFDELLNNVAMLSTEDLVHKVFSVRFINICAILEKLKGIKKDFENLDKTNFLKSQTIKINEGTIKNIDKKTWDNYNTYASQWNSQWNANNKINISTTTSTTKAIGTPLDCNTWNFR
jgi:hypothetical protein